MKTSKHPTTSNRTKHNRPATPPSICSTRSTSNSQPYISHKTTSSHAPPPLPPCTSSSTPLCNTMLLYLILAQLLRVPVLVLHMVPPTRSHHSPIHTHAITLNLPSYSCKHQTHHHTQPHQLRLSRHTHTHNHTITHTQPQKLTLSRQTHTITQSHTHTHVSRAKPTSKHISIPYRRRRSYRSTVPA